MFDVELNKRKLKAQEKGDLAEEAKLCNAVGELLSHYGKNTSLQRDTQRCNKFLGFIYCAFN